MGVLRRPRFIFIYFFLLKKRAESVSMPKTIDISPQKSTIDAIPEYDSELQRAAEAISARAAEALESEEIDPVEAAGHQALASLLMMHIRGELPKDFSAKFLKSIAEKKTPSPVQKVEQTTRVDLNVLFTGLIEGSPDTLIRMTRLAGERAQQVQKRLGVTSDYLLPVDEEDNGQASSIANQSQKPEPVEIIDIRSGGDGSIQYNTPYIPPPPDTKPTLYNIPAGSSSFVDKYKTEETEEVE